MAFDEPYILEYAPNVWKQIERALRWWAKHREKAPQLLARELDRAFDLIANAPELGQKARTGRFGRLYRVLLPKTRYHVYYRILADKRVVQIVLFRHGERRPFA